MHLSLWLACKQTDFVRNIYLIIASHAPDYKTLKKYSEVDDSILSGSKLSD